MKDTLINSILDCKDLIVTLNYRHGSQSVVSYLLPNILYSSNKFWGKFRNIHSSDTLIGIKNTNAISYAYNNFSNVICTSCLTENLERYISSYPYSSIRFHTRGNYKKIWCYKDPNNIDVISEAVKEGLRIKIKITLDGYTYIVPAHTIEIFGNEKTFTLETEYDGYPERLRHFQAIVDLGAHFDSKIDECSANQYPSINFTKNKFYLTSFLLRQDGSLLQRVFNDQGGFNRFIVSPVDFELWAEETSP
jgi:hypothetical protein